MTNWLQKINPLQYWFESRLERLSSFELGLFSRRLNFAFRFGKHCVWAISNTPCKFPLFKWRIHWQNCDLSTWTVSKTLVDHFISGFAIDKGPTLFIIIPSQSPNKAVFFWGGLAPLPLVSYETLDFTLSSQWWLAASDRMAIRKDDDRDLALFCPGTLGLGGGFGWNMIELFSVKICNLQFFLKISRLLDGWKYSTY